MKLFVISAFLLGICAISCHASFDFMVPNAPNLKFQLNGNGKSTKEIGGGVIEQPLDHFNPSNNVFWDQQVFMNDEHYQLGGPAFFFFSGLLNPTGDEQAWLQFSEATAMAELLGGVLYAIVPRYYGASHPTENLSLENLQYLTIAQTLADFEHVVRLIKLGLETLGTTKVIAYGYGTGATFATVLHQQFPGLFNGVLASSAQMQVIPNFYTYYQDISETLRKHASDVCFERIAGGLEESGELIAAGEGVRLQQLFNFLDPVDTNDEREVAAFYSVIGTILGQVVEFGNAEIVDYICNVVEGTEQESDIEYLAYFIRYSTNDMILDVSFRASTYYYQQENWDDLGVQLGIRQLAYVSCNEYVWFKTAPEIPISLMEETCNEMFGIANPVERSLATNARFTLDPNLQNVYFTNGDMDPFRWTSIKTDLNENSPADVIPDVGKGFDLPRLSDIDSAETVAVKTRARNLVKQWIQ